MSNIRGLFSLPVGQPGTCTESTVSVHFDPSHDLFNGHFPGRPVVPGVCLVEAATSIASAMHGAPLRMVKARAIKFLMPVDPGSTPELTYHTKLTAADGLCRVESQAVAGDTVVMKLTAELAPA